MANAKKRRNVPPEEPSTGSSEKQLVSPHDTYVYKTLSDPVLAAAEFKHLLPKEVAAEIDWDNLEQVTNRFSDGKLDNHYTDLLFKTTLRRRPVKLRLLLEHSSYDKPFETLQTLRYQVQEWERESQQNKRRNEKVQRLTPIITIILHHSESGWRGRPRFMDYFGLDDDLAPLLRPYVVDFGIVLDDISTVNVEALVQRPVPPEVQLMLFGLRFGRTGRKVLEELPTIAPVVEELMQDPHGVLAVGVFFLYITRVAKVSEVEVRTKLQEQIESRLDPEIMALYAQFEAGEKRGEKRGKKEGKKEGRREGALGMARSVLKRQLAQRFGSLTPAAMGRLEAATLPELEAMSLRVLTAGTVEEVLGGP